MTDGVVSMRAHSPRRFGTTTSNRPPDARTRHASRSSVPGSLVISSACTKITRSTAVSGSGSSFSVHQRRQSRPRRRPFHHALPGRHERQTPFGFLAEQAEIRRGIADAEHAQAGGVLPQTADAAADEAARHHTELLGVKIAQVHDINRHGLKLS